ncbi:MAG: tRNA 2-thiouridine(34) synthase MnmA [Candidatus Omnitrophica bacterium]|nr:tRNA 2-thiouridine(34) synthase MnmA [Candidatus Omnitrophota bacterium]
MAKKVTVAVAMSGGVDSSVAAAILKDEGFAVIGLTMKLWRTEDCGAEKRKSCCSLRDVEDARAVAGKLDIPFYVIDLSAEFEREVIQYFFEEYKKGRTPNPCIVCNTRLKFGALMRKAKQLGAVRFATGHYARAAHDEKDGRYLLRRGKDKRKDQSYVLFELSQEQLKDAVFPLGEMDKAEVRVISERLGLPVCRKPDSQEICFIMDKDYRSFLKGRGISDSSGTITDISGNILGRHKGIHSFTVGQRKGLDISGSGPYYVISINPDTNTVIVGKEQDLERKSFAVNKLNWISKESPGSGNFEVQIRYNHKPAKAALRPAAGGKVRVEFFEPQRAVTPGQAAVFYKKDMVAGGGWIE